MGLYYKVFIDCVIRTKTVLRKHFETDRKTHSFPLNNQALNLPFDHLDICAFIVLSLRTFSFSYKCIIWRTGKDDPK